MVVDSNAELGNVLLGLWFVGKRVGADCDGH